MSDVTHDAKEQMGRVNARIAQLAADYQRSRMTRDLWKRAGNVHSARQLSKRLRRLDAELAYLARQKKRCECEQHSGGLH
jgi:Ser/Thr protein kinase RdoA (MazF antagonist)